MPSDLETLGEIPPAPQLPTVRSSLVRAIPRIAPVVVGAAVAYAAARGMDQPAVTHAVDYLLGASPHHGPFALVTDPGAFLAGPDHLPAPLPWSLRPVTVMAALSAGHAAMWATGQGLVKRAAQFVTAPLRHARDQRIRMAHTVTTPPGDITADPDPSLPAPNLAAFSARTQRVIESSIDRVSLSLGSRFGPLRPEVAGHATGEWYDVRVHLDGIHSQHLARFLHEKGVPDEPLPEGADHLAQSLAGARRQARLQIVADAVKTTAHEHAHAAQHAVFWNTAAHEAGTELLAQMNHQEVLRVTGVAALEPELTAIRPRTSYSRAILGLAEVLAWAAECKGTSPAEELVRFTRGSGAPDAMERLLVEAVEARGVAAPPGAITYGSVHLHVAIHGDDIADPRDGAGPARDAIDAIRHALTGTDGSLPAPRGGPPALEREFGVSIHDGTAPLFIRAGNQVVGLAPAEIAECNPVELAARLRALALREAGDPGAVAPAPGATPTMSLTGLYRGKADLVEGPRPAQRAVAAVRHAVERVSGRRSPAAPPAGERGLG